MSAAPRSESIARALDAASDLAELLRLAQGAVHRAQAQSNGETYHVASRLSRHLHYMRKVAELLRHEIERFEAAPQETQSLQAIAQSQPTRLPLRVRAIGPRPQDS